ncbi:hypothetical protein BH24BAC1_BH24BAC1_07530 [soil metagenome]
MTYFFRTFLLLLPLLFLFPVMGLAQPAVLEALYQNRMELIQRASLVLAAWAMGNIVISSLNLPKASRSKRYFHQMNIIWNIVNLAIAGYSAYTSFTGDASLLTLAREVREHFLLERILLLNVGLDLAYLMTGLYLQERAGRALKPERLHCYGSSLLLQGSFLLLFDLLFYFLLNTHTGELYQLLNQ